MTKQNLGKRILVMVLVLVLTFSVFIPYTAASERDYILEKAISDIKIMAAEEVKKKKAKREKLAEKLPLSDADISLVARITMAEAEGVSELGKRLVIDTVLNRYYSKYFPNTIKGVLYQKNQFEPMTNGRWDRVCVKNSYKKLVIEELKKPTNKQVLYFRTDYYHSFGTPVISVGNQYFSTR